MIASKKLSKRESPILYVARGQAQVMCNLYVENVPEGVMALHVVTPQRCQKTLASPSRGYLREK